MGLFWKVSLPVVEYNWMYKIQLKAVEKVFQRECDGVLFLLEHEPVFTIGKRGKETNILVPENILHKEGITVVYTDRGGDITYHGPGQLVAYPILDIISLFGSVKRFVWTLEEVVIRLLGEYGIDAGRKDGFPGVWLDNYRKIMSLGVAIRRYKKRWISYHGIAFNVNPIMRHFSYINACGLGDSVIMVSMEQVLGRKVNFSKVKELYAGIFEDLLGIKLLTSDMEGLRLI